MNRSNALIMMAVVTVLAGLLWWGIGSYGVIFAGCLGLLTTFPISGFRPPRKKPEAGLPSAAIDRAAGLDRAREPAVETGPWQWKFLCAAFCFVLIVAGFALAARFHPDRGIAAISAETGNSAQGKHF